LGVRFAIVCLLVLTGTTSGISQTAQKEPSESPAANELLKPGVVVESFDDEFSGAKKAGMQEGDILLRWSQGQASGKFESPFDVSFVVTEKFPLGPVRFEGLRGTESKVWTVTKHYWGATTRPNFSDTALAAYRAAMDMTQADKAVTADPWKTVANDSDGSRFPWLRAWFFGERAAALAKVHHWKEADDAYERAVQESASAGTAVRAQLLFAWGQNLDSLSDLDRAEKCYTQALNDSIDAHVDNLRADILDGLGSVARERGNLSQSQRFFSENLEIVQRLEPGTLAVGSALVGLALGSFDRGDLAEAENYYAQALAIYEKQGPGSVGNAIILNNLGEVAELRGDLDKAERYLRKAVAMEASVDPGSSGHSGLLQSMAKVLEERGNDREAEECLRQSAAIQEKLAPGSLDEAEVRQSLGDLALHHSDFDAAEEAYQQALAVREKLAPEGLFTAETLHSLGDVALAQNKLGKSKNYYQRALAIREKLAPKSAGHADTLAALAGIARRDGQLDQATSRYEQALDALESQSARLGGGADVQGGFRARREKYYREYIALLVSQNKQELALAVLERSRARSLLETLSAGHIDIRKGVDANLLEQERSLQAIIKAKSNRRMQLLTDQHTDEQVTVIDNDIKDLVLKYQEVEGRIRSNSPSYAALTQPQPLDARQIQEHLLDPDALLLEYSLGEEHSYLFAVTPDSLQAFVLPKRAEIEQAARRLYELLTARSRVVKTETDAQRQQRWAQAEGAYPRAVAELSHTVLAPVAAQVGGNGKRLLIVADGALQYIPFAILSEPATPPAADDSTSAPLVLDHEIINLPSASVLSVLRKEAMNRPSAPRAVAVLADPVFDRQDRRVDTSSAIHDLRVATASNSRSGPGQADLPADSLSSGLLTRSAGDIGMSQGERLYLARLLYTRQEAQVIMTVTPPGKGITALDFRASRAMATSPTLAQYRIVHFATHGFLDSKNPELSGLVLSLVNRQGKHEDGFLALQDIYNLNLPVELVVLSGCDTGLGEEIDGEGLIGLTRGFMYAGASRVMASLWSVNDVGTSELMARFYKAMEKDGMRPAAALRTAQIQMSKQRRWRSPFYWAAFQIQGEWK
jgi:CHAT domain-containing protein/Tfp pilus assembly protein PilF